MAIFEGVNGNVANVDSDGRLEVISTSLNVDQRLNAEQKVFTMSGVVTPVGADDYFFYVKNLGPAPLSIGQFWVSTTVPGIVAIDAVSGTAAFVSSTPAVITNTTIGSTVVPRVQADFDTDITGLTKEGELFFVEMDVAGRSYFLNTIGGISINQGRAVAFRRVAATGEIKLNSSLGIVVF